MLGFIAGMAFPVGLPNGWLRTAAPTLSALLHATTAGVLHFLFWDMLQPLGLPSTRL